jgi:hypothetical protein
MRVNHVGVQESSRNRRTKQPSLCMEAAFRASRGNECRRDAGLAGATMRDGACGSYSLVRHNSAVFEHDFDTNRSSLVHAVSEVKREMQLGLSHCSAGHMKSDGYGSDGKSGQRRSGLVRQVSRESHEFSQETYSSLPAPGKKGQINSFVFKNYALHDRRALSLPVGKEYSTTVSQYATEVLTHSDSDSNSRNVTYSERHTSVSSASCDGSDVSRAYDFDMEAERHSKATLFFQAGSTLLTVMVAIFTLYFSIRFLTSETNNHRGEESGLQRHESGVLQDSNSGCSQCRVFAKVCPLLGLLTAGFVVVVGTWGSDGRLWQWSPTPASCEHCEDYEEKRRHAQEADEKVRQADRSKHQFMAYVFHNIRGEKMYH